MGLKLKQEHRCSQRQQLYYGEYAARRHVCIALLQYEVSELARPLGRAGANCPEGPYGAALLPTCA